MSAAYQESNNLCVRVCQYVCKAVLRCLEAGSKTCEFIMCLRTYYMRDLCCQDLLQATYELSHISLGDCVNLLVYVHEGGQATPFFPGYLLRSLCVCKRELVGVYCMGVRLSEHLEGSLLSRFSISSRLPIKMSHLSLGDPYVCVRENLRVFTVCVRLYQVGEHLEGSLLSRCFISSRLPIKMSHLSLGDPYVCV